MARGIKVAGHASLVRSGAIPGLILSSNSEAAAAALRARQHQETKDQTIENQAIQIIQMQDQMKALMEHVGLTEIPQSEDKEDA